MSKEHPTPWTFRAVDAFEDQPILDANGNEVLVRDNGAYPPDLDTCREIVEAVNWYCDWGAMSEELERLRADGDRFRDIVKRIEEEMERCHRRDGGISQELMDAVYEARAVRKEDKGC